MSRVWYTSDTHFDHKFVAGLRGFIKTETVNDISVDIGDTAAHDAEIIRRWNSKVAPGDTVWLLGDVGMGKLPRFREQLKQLNGTIHLITGNHDEVFPGTRDSWKFQLDWMDRFQSIQAYARRKVGSYQFLLSHFPYDGDHTGDDRYTQYRLRDEGLWLVHGHTHQKQKFNPDMRRHTSAPGVWSWRGRTLHIGLDAWDLYPVSQEQVVEEFAKAELVDGYTTSQ